MYVGKEEKVRGPFINTFMKNHIVSDMNDKISRKQNSLGLIHAQTYAMHYVCVSGKIIFAIFFSWIIQKQILIGSSIYDF